MERIIRLRETFQIVEIANFHSKFRNFLHCKEDDCVNNFSQGFFQC